MKSDGWKKGNNAEGGFIRATGEKKERMFYSLEHTFHFVSTMTITANVCLYNGSQVCMNKKSGTLHEQREGLRKSRFICSDKCVNTHALSLCLQLRLAVGVRMMI